MFTDPHETLEIMLMKAAMKQLINKEFEVLCTEYSIRGKGSPGKLSAFVFSFKHDIVSDSNSSGMAKDKNYVRMFSDTANPTITKFCSSRRKALKRFSIIAKVKSDEFYKEEKKIQVFHSDSVIFSIDGQISFSIQNRCIL